MTVPLAVLTGLAAGAPARADGTPSEEPVLIDRVVEIDRVLELRLVEALTAETAAAQAAAEAAAAEALAMKVTFASAGQSGIPVTVLAAYRKAEANLAASMPSCHLPWWLLAGIGRIESGHASGGRVDAAGTTRGRILGVRLDGTLAGTAVIRDSDGGAMDGDPAYDRAVGPMQFLPGTWKAYARDGNGDKIADPHNIFDAATAAGALLCRNGGDLSVPANLARAVLSYNHSESYVRSVLTWGTAYRDGVTPAADGTGSIPTTPVVREPETPPPAAPAPAPTPPPATPAPTPPPSPTTPPPSPTTPPPSPTTPPPSPTTPPPSPTTPPSTTTTTRPPTTTTRPPASAPASSSSSPSNSRSATTASTSSGTRS